MSGDADDCLWFASILVEQMSERNYEIALDIEVGERLERLAAARGVSARELVTAMIDRSAVDTLDAEHNDAAVLEGLEQLWSSVETGTEPVVPHDDVRRWLSTWGTSEFKPWSSNGR